MVESWGPGEVLADNMLWEAEKKGKGKEEWEKMRILESAFIKMA